MCGLVSVSQVDLMALPRMRTFPSHPLPGMLVADPKCTRTLVSLRSDYFGHGGASVIFSTKSKVTRRRTCGPLQYNEIMEDSNIFHMALWKDLEKERFSPILEAWPVESMEVGQTICMWQSSNFRENKSVRGGDVIPWELNWQPQPGENQNMD
eukprot:Gb_34035 [translate_table: standard]